MKLNVDFHSRVLLGLIAVLLLGLSGSWIAIDFAARQAGAAEPRRTNLTGARDDQTGAGASMDPVLGDLWLGAGVITIVGLAVSLVSARLLMRPVRALADASRGIASTDADHAVGDALTSVASALRGLSRSAHYDALTGLPNRTHFTSLLDEALDRARRGRHSLALVFIDLDGFKKINDTLGHKMGDLVLRKTGQRMARSVQAPSSISRLGGDEFVLILDGATQAKALMAVEAMMAAVGVPMRSASGPIRVGMSAGIAIYPQVAADRETLLKLADAAMYRSKSGKCGPVVARVGDVAPVPAAGAALTSADMDAHGETWDGIWRAPTASGIFRSRPIQVGDDGPAGVPAAPIPRDEIERLTALRRLEILDKPQSPSFDRITQLAAKALDVPIVLISLVDERRQWFLSRVGLDVAETSRDVSLCAHAIFARQPLVVSDASLDPRFSSSALVTGEPHLRAYAGVPFFTQAGFAIGTLCAIDRRPRDFRDEELKTLRELAAVLEDLFQAREYRIASARQPAKPTES